MAQRLPAPSADRGTLLDLFARDTELLADRPAATDSGTTFTWRQFGELADALALAYRELGVGRGDFVGLHQRNRFEHVIADAAAMLLGAVPVSVYNTLSSEQLEFIATDTAMKVLVVEDRFLANWLPVLPRLPHLEHVIVIDGSAEEEQFLQWQPALDRGRQLLDSGGRSVLDDARSAVSGDDLATIVYTSGTTGMPKGVLFTHRRIRFTLDMVTDHFARQVALGHKLGLVADRDDPTVSGSRVLSYLPMAHAAERFATYYLALQWGSHIHYVRELDQLPTQLANVEPAFLLGVPRIWEKFGAGMAAKTSGTDAKARIGAAALDVAKRMGEHRMKHQTPGLALRLQHAAFEKTLYPKMRKAMGLNRCGLAMSGAAPIDVGLLCTFSGLGIPIIEGYGMTESGGIATFASLSDLKPGSVGKSVPSRGGGPDRGRRRDPGSRTAHHCRVPQPTRRHRRDDRYRRLAAHRRSGPARPRRVTAGDRAQEGVDHHLGRKEHLAQRHRDRHQERVTADRPRGGDR